MRLGINGERHAFECVGPQQGWTIVSAEHDERDLVDPLDCGPGSAVVHIDAAAIGKQEPLLSDRLYAEISQEITR